MYQNDIVTQILPIRNEKYIYRFKRNAVKSKPAIRHYRKTQAWPERPYGFQKIKIDLLKYHETRAFVLTHQVQNSAFYRGFTQKCRKKTCPFSRQSVCPIGEHYCQINFCIHFSFQNKPVSCRDLRDDRTKSKSSVLTQTSTVGVEDVRA